MKRLLSFMAVLTFLIVSGTAYAVQVQFDNSDDHLGDFLHYVDPSLNPLTGQLPMPSAFVTAGTADTTHLFINVGASFASTDVAGIYLPSISGGTFVPLYNGNNDPYSYYWNGSAIVSTGNSSSTLLNFTGGNLIVTKTDITGGVPTVTTTTYLGVPVGTPFDFYLNPGTGGPFYSNAGLNPIGETQMLLLPDTTGGYYVPMEDLQTTLACSGGGVCSGGNGGFGDVVLDVESVSPVPEPSALLLLGSGLAGLGFWGRKKFKV